MEGPEGTEVTVEAGGRRQVAILSSDSGDGASPGSTEEIRVQGPIPARRRTRILR